MTARTLCLFFMLLLSADAIQAADGNPAKPNIVIVFIDDMGYGDIGPFGATKQKTPNLDRMAGEGMKLTSFYAASVCSVSRAQLLTGCYGARISVPGVYGPGSRNGLNPAEHTLAERLKEVGYATACVGKWHLGDQPEFLPTRQGFDHYFGIPYSNDMQRRSKETGESVVPLLRDEKVAELLTDEQQSRIVERYTDEAVGFIRTNQARPFFLYLPHTAVHTPIWPGEAFRGRSANGRFGDWVEEVDWSVGRVLDTLRELRLDRKTLVVFTSDNGPWLIKGPDGGSAGPLRGGKGSTWEGGVRVPTVAWWPGRIAPGSVCDAVAGTIDLLPTAVALAGGSLPAQPVIDGRDISPLLLGRTSPSPRTAHFYFLSYNLQAVREGPWKLAIAPQRETMGKDVVTNATKTPRLYNLDREIGEQTDLSQQYPEIVARLQSLAEKMDREIGGQQPLARRPAGAVENPQTLYPSESRATKGDRRTAAPDAAVEPADLSKLKPGDSVSAATAPQVGRKPFTISCTVASDQAEGVIVAHGGSAVGYALHLRDGRAVFTVRDRSGEASVAAPFPASADPQQIEASLAKDGVLRLQVGKQAAVTAQGAGVLSRQPQEDFCVGHDNRLPLTKYATTATFRGRISDLKVTIP